MHASGNEENGRSIKYYANIRTFDRENQAGVCSFLVHQTLVIVLQSGNGFYYPDFCLLRATDMLWNGWVFLL